MALKRICGSMALYGLTGTRKANQWRDWLFLYSHAWPVDQKFYFSAVFFFRICTVTVRPATSIFGSGILSRVIRTGTR